MGKHALLCLNKLVKKKGREALSVENFQRASMNNVKQQLHQQAVSAIADVT